MCNWSHTVVVSISNSLIILYLQYDYMTDCSIFNVLYYYIYVCLYIGPMFIS